jgi:HD-GYP domain-containing protein (c-di-GMP phosphodiesterase class II)
VCSVLPTLGVDRGAGNREFSLLRERLSPAAAGDAALRQRWLGYGRVVADEGSPPVEQVRAAEAIAALCLGTDLAMGFPFEHGLHSTLIAMRLAERLGTDRATASETYYACLLMYAGCTTDADAAAETYGGTRSQLVPVTFGSRREMLGGLLRALPDPGRTAPTRAIQVARRLPKATSERDPHLAALCEVAQMLAARFGLPAPVRQLFDLLTERWDGKGWLRRAKGEGIPPAIRIVHVARDAAFQRLLAGEDFAVRVVGERAGHAFDPHVAACLVDGAAEILAIDQQASAWDETLACEPDPHLTLEGEAIDRAVGAIGDFADLISPDLSGHSAGVAELASTAARRCRIDESTVTTIRRAALVHDLGRVAVDPRIWQKPGPLTADEWEHVRLHPYHTERVLSRSPFLSALAPTAGAHHERLDGSGYHRGTSAAELTLPARVLAAADAYHAMTEPRPYREPLTTEQAADQLVLEARAGRLDLDAVTAVVEASGRQAPPLERPAGLTEREAEVVRLLARGLQTKQIAGALEISVKTTDHHIQSAYRKIGVSTRAAATLFAMEHGLLARRDS